jgi:hypothetical protein
LVRAEEVGIALEHPEEVPRGAEEVQAEVQLGDDGSEAKMHAEERDEARDVRA